RLSIFFFLLLFSSHCHHRDLHSFPTRRSSDLFGVVGDADYFKSVAGVFLVELLQPGHLDLAWIAIGSPEVQEKWMAFEVLKRNRSEEHTSELQSLAYLVCRLLLEKKKQKNKHK